jgi:AmmeMemoRadiSam system protein B
MTAVIFGTGITMRKRLIIRVLVPGLIFLAAAAMAVFFYAPRKNEKLLNRPSHYSYFSQKDFYEEAYESALLQTPRPPKGGAPLLDPTSRKASSDLRKEGIPARGIIVNHHLLASSFIAETFNVVATDAPVTVLLVSPNHFDAGRGDIITSAEPWQTPYGILQPDEQLINQLTTAGIANVEESPFQQEHGVSGIVAFIKKSLPNAKVVPVIFRNRMTSRQALDAADGYYQILNADKSARYMLVGSFDFSHYLTSAAADFHDIKNLDDVASFNFADIYNLDIDSRPGLAFFLELLKDFHAQNFNLLENSNSAKLVHQDILETTSYIDGFFAAGDAATTSVDTVLILPSIVSSTEIADSLNRYNKSWAVEYLERLFFGQGRSVVYVDGDKTRLLPELGRYGITDTLNGDERVTVGNRVVQILSNADETRARQAINDGAAAVVQYHGTSDNISFCNNKPIITLKSSFLSKEILKSGGISLAYGLAWANHQLAISLLPIGVKNGTAKLLIGNESDKILAETAANSAVNELIKQEIKQGIITIDIIQP